MDDGVTRRATLAAIGGVAAAGGVATGGRAPLLSDAGQRHLGAGDPRARDGVNIADHGAIGDGDPAHAARNTAAIRAAIARAVSLGHPQPPFATAAEIVVPPGVFVVEAGAIAVEGAAVLGLRMRGAGWFASRLRLVGTGWIFDNAGGYGMGERLVFPMFTDLGFEGCEPVAYDRRAIPPGTGTMRVESHVTAQGFRFERCLFAGFDTCFRFQGTDLGSENKFIDCKFFACNTAVEFANPQSFNTDFIGTEIETIYRSVFHFAATPNGVSGGAVRVSHGSLVPSADCAIVRVDGTSINQGVVIRDTRIEMRERSRYFEGNGFLFSVALTLVDCGILNTEQQGIRTIARVGDGQTLQFVRCAFDTLGQEERFAFLPTRGRYMTGPRIIWDDCEIPPDLAARIDSPDAQNDVGQASARNCRSNVAGDNVSGTIHAVDFDSGGSGLATAGGGSIVPAQGGDAQLRRKTVALKLGLSSWPRADGRGGVVDETRLVLPPGARITRIAIVRPSDSGTAAYALRVRTEAGVVLFDTPAIAGGALVHRQDWEAGDRVPPVCGAALPERTLVLTAAPAMSRDATRSWRKGDAYVEYM